MRAMSDEGVPFSMEFLSHNASKGLSTGVKIVNRCVLRPGYNADQSQLRDVLVHYTDLDSNKPGIFYAPLLLKFQNTLLCRIKP